MENSSNTYVKNSAGTFLENITKNTKNILGGVSNTQESNNFQQQNTPFENCGVVGCWGTDSQGRKTLNGQVYIESKKILCNDGSFDIQAQEPSTGMGKVSMACNGKGGISVNQPTPYTTPTQGNKTKEPIYYILVTAGVMIAGYFAYKKFKK
jgi:hypothetical protein